MPITPPPSLMVPSKCVFYLNGTKEYTNKWHRPTFDTNNVEIIDDKYTSKNNSARVSFLAKKPIKNNTKAFTITCFVKRNIVVYSGWGEIGFFLDNGVSYDCGFSGANLVYLDDKSSIASWAQDAETVMNGNYTDRYFFAFCREEDGTNHVFLNGKLVGTTSKFSSKLSNFTQINLFDADSGGSIVGWIDKVIIHKDICMYKEDFTPPNYDTDYNFDVNFSTDDDYMKLY